MRSAHRFAMTASMALALFAGASPASANGVVALEGATPPTTLDLTTAVAVSPFGSIRWSRVAFRGVEHAMWLVPVRPGAALDWANPSWFDALESATAPKILHPPGTDRCAWPEPVQAVPPFTASGPLLPPKTSPRVHTDLADLRAHVAASGFALSPEAIARLTALHAQGYRIATAVFALPPGATFTSPTLRIVDDGAAVVPMALVGSPAATVRSTAYVIADRPLTLPGATDAAPQLSLWGRYGSSYPEDRLATLTAGAGNVWLRESTRPVLAPPTAEVPSLYGAYFGKKASCVVSAVQAADADGAVGRSCPSGALAVVPGGSPCTPTTADVDPSALGCEDAQDLALALGGLSIQDATVSRFVGIVPPATLGHDLALVSAPGQMPKDPTQRANNRAPCADSPPAVPPSSPSGPSRSPAPSPSPAPADTVVYYGTTDGCSGGTSSTYVDDSGGSSSSDDEDDDDDDGWDSSDSSDSCASDSSSSSSSGSDDDGWDSDDSSSDSCASGSSSSSSSGSDDDGWDSDDSSSGEMAPTRKVKSPLHKRPHASRRGRSPVSRYAFVAIALLLPLRRRLRQRTL